MCNVYTLRTVHHKPTRQCINGIQLYTCTGNNLNLSFVYLGYLLFGIRNFVMYVLSINEVNNRKCYTVLKLKA